MLTNYGISSEIWNTNPHPESVLTKDHLGVRIPGAKCFKNGQHTFKRQRRIEQKLQKTLVRIITDTVLHIGSASFHCFAYYVSLQDCHGKRNYHHLFLRLKNFQIGNTNNLMQLTTH